MIESFNLAAAFARFDDRWSPKIVGEVNDAHVKLVKLHGDFVWHHHEHEDELFFVVRGRLTMKLRDGVVVVEPADIVAGEQQGLRALYVALTRSTKRLSIVHAKPLPAAML